MPVTYEGSTDQVRQIVHHHAVLRRGLERRSGALCEAAANGVRFQPHMTALRDYLTSEIFPHAEVEERILRPAAASHTRFDLVHTLTREHRELAYLAGRLQPGVGSREAATVSEWIATLFAGHVAKVNDLLPALAEAGAVLALRDGECGVELRASMERTCEP